MRLAILGLLGGWLLLAGCGDGSDGGGAPSSLIVVSPHPDDESIFGAATIHRLAADPRRDVRAIYISGGDGATVAGDCNGIPEEQKKAMIVALREDETRAAWQVLAPGRDVPLHFLRAGDQRTVASSTIVDGVRQDVLSAEGQGAVDAAVAVGTDLPPSVRHAQILTASRYDAHPDHRTAYRAARAIAERLAADGVAVRLWSWIVHDEIGVVDVPRCCIGDFHWPSAGPTDDYAALTDAPVRPRPPRWNHVEDVHDLVDVRRDALARHVSQVVGWPPLCMPVYLPAFYTRWTDKVEEPFYEEVF